MRLVVPVLSKVNLPLNTINFFFNILWRRIEAKNGLVLNAMVPSIDKEAMGYGSRNVIFDVQKIKNTGFQWKHSVIRDG